MWVFEWKGRCFPYTFGWKSSFFTEQLWSMSSLYILLYHKNELAEHTSEVHQNGQNLHDNHIISQVKADMKWLSHVKFKQLLAANNLVEVIVPGNGFCFLSTLLVTLDECGTNKDMNNLSIEVMNEIRNNMEMYKEILPMESEQNIFKACEAFFQVGIYSHEFVDFCIAASANALGVNIHIFQRGTYRVTVISINCHKFVSTNDIFCMFHKSKKSVNNLDCHYNPYVESEYLKTHKEEIKSRFVLSLKRKLKVIPEMFIADCPRWVTLTQWQGKLNIYACKMVVMIGFCYLHKQCLKIILFDGNLIRI